MHQILIAFLIPGQQDQMIGVLTPVITLFFKTRPGSHIGFHAYNRLDPLFHHGSMKFDYAEHITVISDRDRGHIEFLCLFYKIFDSACAVKQAVMRMIMQMYKSRHEIASMMELIPLYDQNLFGSFDLSPQFFQFHLNSFISPVNMIDSGYVGFSLCNQAGDDQRGAGTQIRGHDLCPGNPFFPPDHRDIMIEYNIGSQSFQLGYMRKAVFVDIIPDDRNSV